METILTEIDEDAVPEYGLGKGVKPENVYRRERTLIAHGTNPLEARRLAMEAENQQVARDGQTKRERDRAEEEARMSVGDRLKRMNLASLLKYAKEEQISIPEKTVELNDVRAFLLAQIND